MKFKVESGWNEAHDEGEDKFMEILHSMLKITKFLSENQIS